MSRIEIILNRKFSVGDPRRDIESYLELTKVIKKYFDIEFFKIRMGFQEFESNDVSDINAMEDQLNCYVRKHEVDITHSLKYGSASMILKTTVTFFDLNSSNIQLPFYFQITPEYMHIYLADTGEEFMQYFVSNEPREWVIKNCDKIKDILQNMWWELNPDSLIAGELLLNWGSPYWIEYQRGYQEFIRSLKDSIKKEGRDFLNYNLKNCLKTHNLLDERVLKMLENRKIRSILPKKIDEKIIKDILLESIEMYPGSEVIEKNDHIVFITSKTFFSKRYPRDRFSRDPDMRWKNASDTFYTKLFLKLIESIKTKKIKTVKPPYITLKGSTEVNDSGKLKEFFRTLHGVSMFEFSGEKGIKKLDENKDPASVFKQFIKDVERDANKDIKETIGEDTKDVIREVEQVINLANEEFNLNLKIFQK